jgi:hypothetical protein
LSTTPYFFQALPAEYSVHNVSQKVQVHHQDIWSLDAIKYFEKCLKNALSVYIQPTLTIKDKEILFGELLIEKPNGEFYELSDKLVEHKMAFIPPPEKFMTMYNRSMSSIIERWDDNSRSGGAANKPDCSFFGEIAESSNRLIKRSMHRNLLEKQIQIEEQVVINKSIQKVIQWQMTQVEEPAIPEQDEIPVEDSGLAEVSPELVRRSDSVEKPVEDFVMEAIPTHSDNVPHSKPRLIPHPEISIVNHLKTPPLNQEELERINQIAAEAATGLDNESDNQDLRFAKLVNESEMKQPLPPTSKRSFITRFKQCANM